MIQSNTKADNYLRPILSVISPLPHLALSASLNGKSLKVTLDTGATVSFVSKKLVERLGVSLRLGEEAAR